MQNHPPQLQTEYPVPPPVLGQGWPKALARFLFSKRHQDTSGHGCPACGQAPMARGQVTDVYKKIKHKTCGQNGTSGQSLARGGEDSVLQCPDASKPLAKRQKSVAKDEKPVAMAEGFLSWLLEIGEEGLKSTDWLLAAYHEYCEVKELQAIPINTIRRDLVRLGVKKQMKDVVRAAGVRKRQTFYHIKSVQRVQKVIQFAAYG